MFRDRADAGRRLATRLAPYAREGVVVLGLPRGGVPVAYQVATALHVPLDVLVVRKLGVPYQPELAMGAVGEDGVRVIDARVTADARITPDDLAAVEKRESEQVLRRVAGLRGGAPARPLAGVTAIVVDDGIATGSTARAACRVARARGAAAVVLAVPVAPRSRLAELEQDADEVICLETPSFFMAVGQFYADFSATSDAEVATLLQRAAAALDDADGGQRTD